MVVRTLSLVAALTLAALPLLGACDADPCPRGSMLDSVGGLVVTADEHPTGWGDARCDDCHAFDMLHRIGCTPGVRLDEIRAEVDLLGVEACMACHGDNGVVQ